MNPTILTKAMTVWTRVFPLRRTSNGKRTREGTRKESHLSVKYGERCIIFDFETRDEPGQRPLLGSFQVRHHGNLVDIGLVAGDSLNRKERRTLQKVARHRCIRILTRDEFAELLRQEVHQIGSLCIGHNLPFDTSRIAHAWGVGNGQNAGAFNLYLERNTFRPYVRIKHRNRRHSVIKFVPANKTEKPHSHHEGHFIDTHTLVAALTDDSMSLEAATKHYRTKTQKHPAKRHGVISPKYIEYNLNDVQATWEIYCVAMADYSQLGLTLPPHKAVSTATLGKAHLDQMGIRPRMVCQPDFPIDINGFAMEAYYGGRVEGHWPNEPLVVSYLDVLSMYPTVFVLQGLWWSVVAARLEPVDCTEDVRQFVDQVTLEDLMQPSTWLFMPKLVLVEPNNDRLPVRADYCDNGDLQIGLNYLASSTPRWYTLADVIVSTLHTGRPPKILRAIGLEQFGLQDGLRSMKIRRLTPIDPRYQDFFKLVIEHRHDINAGPKPLLDQDEAHEHCLKILANSTAYGIFAEFNEAALRDPETIDVLAGCHFEADVGVYEKPGRFCFPFIAACVTGGARLLLTLIELQAAKLGASYAMCDTDSMAITDLDGTVADKVVKQFESLNPYAFGGSILKIEDENKDPNTRERRPLYALVKASKRYVLFNIDPVSGRPIIRKALEHGLGHLIAPAGETRESWIEKFWYSIACQAMGLDHERPKWFDDIAMSQLGISTPYLMRPFHASKTEHLESGGWPFNFMLVGYPLGPAFPEGWCRKHDKRSIGCRDSTPCKYREKCPITKPIRPVAPFHRSVKHPEKLPWIDAHTGSSIIVDPPGRPSGKAGHVSLKTFGDLYADFIDHIDRKAATAQGDEVASGYRGELMPLRVEESDREYTGKEAPEIELAEVFGDAHDRYIKYDQGWPALRAELAKYSRSAVARISGMARSQVCRLLNGDDVPQLATVALLRETLIALRRMSPDQGGLGHDVA